MDKGEFIKIVNDYEPNVYEMSNDQTCFYPGSHYLQVEAFRYFKMLNTISRNNINGTLVDIGCYPGTLLKLCQKKFPDLKLIGVGLGLHKEFVSKFNGIKFIDVNIDPDIYFKGYHSIPCDLGIEKDSIDIVVATEIWEHLYNPYHLLREMYRVLKPGGLCYMTTNNISSLPGVLRVLKGDTNLDKTSQATSFNPTQKTNWRRHVRFYCKREIFEGYQNVGFTDINISSFSVECWYKKKQSTLLKNIIKKVTNYTNSRYGTNLECVAKK